MPGADDDVPGRSDGHCDRGDRGHSAIRSDGSLVFLALAIRELMPASAPSCIGTVHAGFFAGMQRMWSELRSMLDLKAKVIVGGHSLGAARAGDLTGLMVLDNRAPIARVVFGEPKPGYMDLAKLIELVPGRSYRNGDQKHHDLVTDVPFSFPPFQYVHPTPIIPVLEMPSADGFSSMGVFAYHHTQLYAKATPETVII